MMTTGNDTGLAGNMSLPAISTARAMPPMVSDVGFVSDKEPRMWAEFSQKSPCTP